MDKEFIKKMEKTINDFLDQMDKTSITPDSLKSLSVHLKHYLKQTKKAVFVKEFKRIFESENWYSPCDCSMCEGCNEAVQKALKTLIEFVFENMEFK